MLSTSVSHEILSCRMSGNKNRKGRGRVRRAIRAKAKGRKGIWVVHKTHTIRQKKTKTFTKKRKQQNRLEKQANEIRGGRTEVSSTRSAASNYIYKYRDVHTQTGTQADRQTHVALSFVRLA